MKRAFAFVESLDSTFFDACGFPSIEVHSKKTEVCFHVSIMRSFKFFDRGDYDSVRVFANGDLLTIVYVFNNE